MERTLRDRIEEYKSYYRSKPSQEELLKVEKSTDSLIYLKNIVNYFKQNYAWNGRTYIGASVGKSQKEILNFKKGYSSELNLLLNALIKEAGYKTDLILISERSNGIPMIFYPVYSNFQILFQVLC